MKPVLLLLPLVLSATALPLLGADDPALDAAVARAVLEYAQRVESATKELAQARVTVANDRTPLLDEIRAAEEKITQLEAEVARLTIDQARTGEKAQSARADQVTLDRNLSYVANIVLDGFKSYEGNLLPGEAATLAMPANELRQRVETAGRPDDALAALEATTLFLARLQRQLGGYTAPGKSLRDGDNQILEGTFAFLGPDVYFRSRQGDVAGMVRERKDSEYVVTYPLPDWNAAQAEALMRGETSAVLADVSGGKALRLREMRGTLWETLQQGGIVGYVIMGLGLVAATITLMKLLDLRHLSVDDPTTVFTALDALARGDRTGAAAAAKTFRASTQELFNVGLRYMDGPRLLLEDQFESFVLRYRLQHERRLPLLAVIATAGPLLGLLGTVTGMIKTFTLITVFGTGSAGKLSGGISEALVATGLGLAVAIPTLVIHGFLSHRIHKGLALLERYSLEFVTAVEEAQAGGKAPPSPRP